MMSREQERQRQALPDRMREELRVYLRSGEEPQVALEGDLELSGQFGRAWLLATSERLLSLQQRNDAFELAAELPMAEARAVRARHFLNNGVIEAELEDRS